MEMKQGNVTQLAQSASALGAGILGFGLGAMWGSVMGNYAIIVILLGAMLHVGGMYVSQMKYKTERNTGIAMMLWASAWVCLIALIAIISWLIFWKSSL